MGTTIELQMVAFHFPVVLVRQVDCINSPQAGGAAEMFIMSPLFRAVLGLFRVCLYWVYLLRYSSFFFTTVLTSFFVSLQT